MSGSSGMTPLNDLEKVLEAMLFVSSEPVRIKDLSDLLDERPQTIENAFYYLQKNYETGGRGMEILRVAGGWQMVSHHDLNDILENFTDNVRRQKIRLSKAAMECLAVTAYNQPVTRSEIEEIRGVRCERVLDTLLSHKLIRIAGRGKGTGSPLLYRTTDNFLTLFGLDSISDLPTLEELDEISTGDPDLFTGVS